MDSDPIFNSSPAKRAKYDSDSDDGYGPNAFGQEETIATLVQHTLRSPSSESVSRVPSSSPPRHMTQPTQIVQSTPKSTAKSSQILVPGTSSPAEKKPVAPLPRNGMLMAPPGTIPRPPIFQGATSGPPPKPRTIPPVIEIDLDDPPIPSASDSDDDMARSRSDIPSTVFRVGNSFDKFKQHVSGFANGSTTSTVPQKRPAEDSVGAYASASRGPVRPMKQNAPAKATPVAKIMVELEDIPEWDLREKAKHMKSIYSFHSVNDIYLALLRHKENADDAMDWLAQKEERAKASVIDITGSDDELAPSPDRERTIMKPTAKRTVDVPQKSLIQRYGGAQQKLAPTPRDRPLPSSQASQASQASPPRVQKPLRRLQKGFRSRAPTPDPEPLPEDEEVVDLLYSDESEAQAEAAEDDHVEEVVLKWLNSCSDKDMVEIASCNLEIASLMISKRPFRSLHQARKVCKPEEDSETQKAKKKRGGARKPVGERVVNVALEAHSSFAAIDRLVSRCESYSTMIKKEMKAWGIVTGDDNQSDNGSRQDSGIGTPTHGYTESTIKHLSSSQDIPKEKLISQPSIMADSVVLKDYQVIGLNWINLLWTKKLSCILADEMGLGKTCQVISFLSHLKEEKVAGPHLVVVPASTLVNWLREFKKFSPQLEVQPYHGPEKERREHALFLEDNRDTIDVIVTTYEMAVKKDDNAVFRRLKPTVCVFDEGHALKNKNSQRYQWLMKIKTQFRLMLTGTPLQNNLQEMISILAFLMPSMFEDCIEDLEYLFKHRAKTTDADHAALLSAQRISRARSIITPFLLRRKKANVLTDLPKKISRVEYCDMTPKQQDIYNDHTAYHQEHLAARAAGEDTGMIVNFLMNRRKAALHPLLFRQHYTAANVARIAKLTPKKRSFKYFKDLACLEEHFAGFSDIALHKHCEELQEKEHTNTRSLLLKNNEWMDSGKVKALADLLVKHAKNGDRTLLFSRFTMVLDVLELVLTTLDMPFLRIDGTTPVTIRQDLIDQYYQDTSIKVFMLSTGAGGTGINLACANKVVIFDSSFNPQDDIQAENRAHRVGQTREVEVIRLVTRGTIEEQIHALGNSKLVLDERVAGDGDEAGFSAEAEKRGQDLVEKMLMESAVATSEVKHDEDEKDLKDMFKDGLAARGVVVLDE